MNLLTKTIASLLLAFLGMALVQGCAKGPEEPGSVAPTVIVLVRHAEKLDSSEDPPLTPAGHERAALLANMLQDVPLSAVYSTRYQRNRDTVGPVAGKKGLETQVYEPSNPSGFMAQVLEKHKGEAVLIVGHTDNVPKMLNFLVRKDLHTDIPMPEYDGIYIVTVASEGHASILKLRFGQGAAL